MSDDIVPPRPRASGILLHPTSLPGPHGCGDLGADAYRFVDWLAQAGQSLWQVLPLGGIGPGGSPYMSPSAFAGNPLLVDLAELASHGWLDEADLAPHPGFEAQRVRFDLVVPWRMERLARAAARFALDASDEHRRGFAAFCEAQRAWLDDFALFMLLSELHPGVEWHAWPAALAAREPAALDEARSRHAPRLDFWRFVQWCFHRQWSALRRHAHERGVRLVGDAPIFVAGHSADVWAQRALFELDPAGRPTVVAGVPPDYFSATGQRWGNPLYRWEAHAADGYAWWIERLRHLLGLVDLVRIDHFRGFASYWEIPAGEPTAVIGRWRAGPGVPLFDALARALGPLPLVAEDLGLITRDVEALRRTLGLPGMRVLHFAFGGDASHRYLPHNHEHDTVVYTGTHDNDTTLGWWRSASEHERDFARRYLATDGHEIAWSLLRAAIASVADTAIAPLQDVLSLGSEARMNRPGDGDGWWTWRFETWQLGPAHAQRLAELCRLYGRAR